MAITKEKYDLIKNSPYAPHASWAVWHSSLPHEPVKAHMGNMNVFNMSDQLLSELHTDVIFVALNSADRDIQPQPFSAFHDTSRHAMDYKMRYAFRDTLLWGSYITDFFHGLRETDSSKVKKYLINNPEYLEESIKRFKSELEFVSEKNTKPILIALGTQVKGLLQQFVADEYRVLELPHYSYSVMTKELYREKAITLLADL